MKSYNKKPKLWPTVDVPQGAVEGCGTQREVKGTVGSLGILIWDIERIVWEYFAVDWKEELLNRKSRCEYRIKRVGGANVFQDLRSIGSSGFKIGYLKFIAYKGKEYEEVNGVRVPKNQVFIDEDGIKVKYITFVELEEKDAK